MYIKIFTSNTKKNNKDKIVDYFVRIKDKVKLEELRFY